MARQEQPEGTDLDLLEQDAFERILLKEKLPRKKYVEATGEIERCRQCGGEMVFLDDTKANCVDCQAGFEWPRPASEFYPDKPWKCPICHGVIVRVTDVPGGSDEDDWRCQGFPSGPAGAEMADKAFGVDHAEKLWKAHALPKEGCGWEGKDSDYGKVWR